MKKPELSNKPGCSLPVTLVVLLDLRDRLTKEIQELSLTESREALELGHRLAQVLKRIKQWGEEPLK